MKYTISKHGKTWRLETAMSSDEVVEIKYSISRPVQRGFPNLITRRQMAEDFRDFVKQDPVTWINPGYQRWIFDLGNLRKSFPELSSNDWLVGKIAIEPDFETFKSHHEALMEAHLKQFGRDLQPFETYIGELIFTIVPELIAPKY